MGDIFAFPNSWNTFVLLLLLVAFRTHVYCVTRCPCVMLWGGFCLGGHCGAGDSHQIQKKSLFVYIGMSIHLGIIKKLNPPY